MNQDNKHHQTRTTTKKRNIKPQKTCKHFNAIFAIPGALAATALLLIIIIFNIA
jgi:hypothetical protein